MACPNLCFRKTNQKVIGLVQVYKIQTVKTGSGITRISLKATEVLAMDANDERGERVDARDSTRST